MQEIERKWLIGILPENLDSYSSIELVAGYFKDKDRNDVRIRQEDSRYFKVSKSGSGLVRDIGPEGDTEITKDEFNSLWSGTKGRRIRKRRYFVIYSNFRVELDVYHDFPGFYTAEVEFDTTAEAISFIPLNWFGREVTYEKEFSSNSIATYGLPQKIHIIPEFNLTKGLEKLFESVKSKLKVGAQRVIILIAGGSASGKTSSVAKSLKLSLDKESISSAILSMDDYYRGKSFMKEQATRGNILNWDQPEAVNLMLLSYHISRLRAGFTIDKPKYSFKTGEVNGTEKFEPVQVVIIEGLFALHNYIAKDGDVKIFVDIGFHGRILRRLLRDVKRTGQSPADILDYFSKVVEPMHEKHIQISKFNADFVINNEYSPKVEAQRSGLHEVQLKFKTSLTVEELRKFGAERLTVVIQTDHYYNPKDRNLGDTDEVLRIREEAGMRIFSYKGPPVDSEFRKRPKFEFEIGPETNIRFTDLYGQEIKTIIKHRILFQLDGVIFSLDDVNIKVGSYVVLIGRFLEVRSTDQSVGVDKIKEVIAKLGFKFSDGIKKSYFDM